MKKTVYVFLLFTGITTGLFAQQLPGFGTTYFSNNQQLIEDAVKDGLFVMSSYYKLQDTTKTEPAYYGRKSLPYFGVTYTLGIKVKNGYFISNAAVHPWMGDSNYRESTYRNDNRYVPVVSEYKYRLLDDTAYQPLPLKDATINEISKNRSYFVRDAVFQNEGFNIDTSTGMKKGWLVWATTDKPLAEQPEQALSFTIYRAEVVFEKSKDSYEIKAPATDKIVLGGFFVLPVPTGIGQIEFKLTGILANEMNQWSIVRMTSTEADSSSGSGISKKNSGLTPIQDENDPAANRAKDKKNKK